MYKVNILIKIQLVSRLIEIKILNLYFTLSHFNKIHYYYNHTAILLFFLNIIFVTIIFNTSWQCFWRSQ